MSRITRAAIVVTSAAVAGCAIGPEYSKADLKPNPAFDSGMHEGVKAAEPATERWWLQFNDPVLAQLVERADMQNLDLKRALLAVETYRAQYTIDFSKLFPDIQTGIGYARRRVDSNQLGVQNPDVLRRGFDTWSWQMASATWELDVWGAVRRQVEAGVASLQATVEQYNGALVSVRAEVANAYMVVRQLQAQRAALAELAEGYAKLQVAVEAKSKHGMASDLELGEIRARRASADGDAVRLDGEIARQQSAIAILLGEPPASVRHLLAERKPVPTVDVPVAVGVPATLLQRRPDVRAAERRAQAANAEIGVAQAAYLPKFLFVGNFTVQTPDFANLGNVNQNQTYVANPAIAWNFMYILTGAAGAREKQAKAAALDALLQYQQASVRAVNEVDASITILDSSTKVRLNYRKANDAVGKAYDLAIRQYEAGTINITALVQYLESVVRARVGLAQSEGLVAQNYVELYRALGGGWDATPAPKAIEEMRMFNPAPTANDFLSHGDEPAPAPTQG
jgi:NodT family efflux transporter outer membrane factor (OMF) lipoprotein